MLRRLVSLTLAATICLAAVRKNITVGYLTAVKGTLKDKQGSAISGAIALALSEVNNNSTLLPNVTLDMKWVDTRGESVATTRAVMDMVCDGVYAFFGPEESCHVESIIAQARNIPMISYKCSDNRASAVPTFARTEPPNTQVTKSLVALLEYYDWHKFSIIREETWTIVGDSLEAEALKKNMKVNHKKSIMDRHLCCEMKHNCCHTTFWYDIIQETKNSTRIYVFLGTAVTLIDMMSTMQALQMFENGDYIVIYVDTIPFYQREEAKYLWKATINNEEGQVNSKGQIGAMSLLVVVSSPPSADYEDFTKNVREYNTGEPFNFPTPQVFTNVSYEKFVSIYAAYLYDSVKLYATALDDLLKGYPELNDTIIEEVGSNGTKIIETIINRGSYISITGTTIKLDSNGDSEGNFSVYSFIRNPHEENSSACGLNFVGQFHHKPNSTSPEFKAYNPVQWINGKKPDDEPSFGFNNEKRPKDDSQKGSIIAAIVLAIVLFCATVSTISIYRKWKIEQEIEGLLWKIDISELHIISSPRKISLVSAFSFDSRCGAQRFALTSQFRGLVVRVKEINFSRKKDISRDIRKEMRLLRELRHDNINSFIGAVVEPMRVLVVMDYCSNGSLYDILENEDIKLDKMFIASLICDLIKGMIFLHNSLLGVHGNLKSSNCVVTSRWVLQVSDFGLHEIRHCSECDSIGEHQYYQSLLWVSPEILRNVHNCRGTQKGDVYAFAIILHEVIGRWGPFGACGIDEPKEIIRMVKKIPEPDEMPFRPSISVIRDSEVGTDFIIDLLTDAWSEDPEMRPDFPTIRARLKGMRDGKHRNIMDQMMEMMERYANNLEDLVDQRTLEVYEEKRKTEDLLHRMLPVPVAKRLTSGFGVEPESFDLVTIYFSDIVGFTAMSAESTPLQVVNFLNDLYTLFDSIIRGYDVYKVETIGDAYMVVSGLPLKNGDYHAGEIASMSLDLLRAVKNYQIAHRPGETLKLRIGIHTGPVVAGVVGLTMPRYCLFGDTVNTASRMESNGEPLRIHISESCKDTLEKLRGYVIEPRGLVNMKGKGLVNTYWLVGATDEAIKPQEVDLNELPPPLFCRKRSILLQIDSRRQSNDIRPLPQITEEPQIEPTVCGFKSLEPLPYQSKSKSLIKRSCHSLQEESGLRCRNGALVNAPLLPNDKRWHSLEIVPPSEPCSKKGLTGSSFRSWLFGIFNNTYHHRSSDMSLRKADYQDLQPERESIV